MEYHILNICIFVIFLKMIMNLISTRNNKTRRHKCYLVRKSPKSLNLMFSSYKASMSTFFIIPPKTRKVLITLSHGLSSLRIVINRNVMIRIFLSICLSVLITEKLMPIPRTIAMIHAQDK